jgi:hypothetical protein
MLPADRFQGFRFPSKNRPFPPGTQAALFSGEKSNGQRPAKRSPIKLARHKTPMIREKILRRPSVFFLSSETSFPITAKRLSWRGGDVKADPSLRAIKL